MPTYGKICPFDPKDETWERYVIRMRQFFLANEIIDEEKKKNIFLTSVGTKTFNLLFDLFASGNPASTPFEDLISALTAHFCPKPSEILESFKFRSRNRLPGESIAEFVANLRRLASTCSFEQSSLDRTLRDQFVLGVGDEVIQQRLFEEQTLKFDRAIAIAVAMESATRNTQELKAPITSELVHKMASHHPGSSKEKSTGWKVKASARNKPPGFCMRCGGQDHTPSDCPFISATCRKCGIVGHLARRCLTGSVSKGGNASKAGGKKGTKQGKNVNILQQTEADDEYPLFHLDSTIRTPGPIIRHCKVDGHQVAFELDTGAAYSLVPESLHKSIFGGKLKPVSTILKSFTGQKVKILGTLDVKVEYQGLEGKLPLMVYAGDGPNLCGRNWLASRLGFLGASINSIDIPLQTTGQQPIELGKLLSKHSNVFEEGLGTMKGILIHLDMKSNVQPKFAAARPVPYALRDKVEKELVRLEDAGIISPVGHAEYASPIVTVLKKDNTVRLCGDFKATVNPNLDTECYPLPKVEDIFAKLAGGKHFTKLDLRDAFNQLELDDDSKRIVVINTQKGLFRYNRLPFGISSSPAIFQRVIENLVKGIPTVSNFQDDILVTGINDEAHLKSLGEVLRRLENSGLKLRREKCSFFAQSVTHLGYQIDEEGLHPLKTKLEAIMNVPAPTAVDQLRSFLGMITYYGKFIRNQATLFAPLYKLLNKDQKWLWGEEQKKAFQAAKEAICESSVLVHYDPGKEILLACDASPYGIGAVLSHRSLKGTDQPIAFASRSLTSAEKNYSQLEREALSLIFGVTKFRDYLIGHTFILQTDHQPLVSLLSEKKPVPRMAAARIQRWVLTLAAYSYKLMYRKGKLHGNADALSRLPLKNLREEVPEPMELVLLAEEMKADKQPLSVSRVREGTQADPLMAQVLSFVKNGWPQKHKLTAGDGMSYYFAKRLEISAMQEILLWGTRVIVPPDLRRELLEELHDGHQGMTLMKSLARRKVWWPGIDSDIVKWVACCTVCQQTAPMPAATVYAPWPRATGPWHKIHADYAGPIEGKMLLIVVDSYSKWMEVEIVQTASAQVTVTKLRQMFARHGLPYTIVTDNGTPFTGSETSFFFKQNGVKHLTIAPYHPASNGQAERAVRIIKQGLKKITGELLMELEKTSGMLQTRLDRVLINYRRTPVTSTGRAPADLFYGRSIRTRLDNIHPREIMTDQHVVDVHHKNEETLGTRVLARNYGKGPKWLEGEISRCIGTAMFEIKTSAGKVRRHRHQIRFKKMSDETSIPNKLPTAQPMLSTKSLSNAQPMIPNNLSAVQTDRVEGKESKDSFTHPSPDQDIIPPVGENTTKDSGTDPKPITPVRRSNRERRPPIRMNL